MPIPKRLSFSFRPKLRFPLRKRCLLWVHCLRLAPAQTRVCRPHGQASSSASAVELGMTSSSTQQLFHCLHLPQHGSAQATASDCPSTWRNNKRYCLSTRRSSERLPLNTKQQRAIGAKHEAAASDCLSTRCNSE